VLSFVASTNMLTVLASIQQPWRVVISEQNHPGRQELAFPWAGLRRRLYGRADLVTANSRSALQVMRAYVEPAKLTFLPNPLVLPDPATVPPAAARQPVFLAVGRLHPQKAYDVLLRAFAELPAGLRAWRLVVLGQGPLREGLGELAASLGVADRVDWCGYVADPRPHYAAAGVFVQPSRHEGMSNALLEAMSFGVAPIISDTSGGGLEVVTDGDTGRVVPSGDVAALSAALGQLARDAELRARLGAAARARVADFALPRALTSWDAALGLDRSLMSSLTKCEAS
jgi:glycosyltransferase involved in cell wall biosynthesis